MNVKLSNSIAKMNEAELRAAQYHVMTTDQSLLGTLVGTYRDGNKVRAVVKHFCGDDWPVSPILQRLTLLSRREQDGTLL